MEIKRFDIYGRREYHENGALVDAADHLATVEALKKRIEELEAERKWIPVTERLPNMGDHVLVVRPDSPTTVRKIHFIMWSEDDQSDFSHWMSCPDFPEAPQ